MAASGGLLTGAAGVPNSTLCGPNLMTETGKFYAVFHTKFLAPARADKLTIKCMDFRSAGDTIRRLLLLQSPHKGKIPRETTHSPKKPGTG